MLTRLIALIAFLLLATPAAAERTPTVLAAASLQGALDAVAEDYVRRGGARPVIAYAGSPALARQAMAGAPADLFISADEAWMDALAARRLIVPATRATLVSNRLVLVAGRGWRGRLAITPGFALARALGRGRLALADPTSVPAGRYARQALTRLGVWASVAPRVAGAENVRAALALVERGAAPLGIVYATDVRGARGVRIVGRFPAAAHAPIRYPLARLARSRNPEGERFRRFLLSPRARAIFRRHGFLDPL